MEREVLWRIAPHIVWPLRFVLPHHKGLRPGLAAAARPVSSTTTSAAASSCRRRARSIWRRDPAGAPAEAGRFHRAFEYSDCWVEDARLVALNARDAADRGAAIRPAPARLGASAQAGLWQSTPQDTVSGERREVARRRSSMRAAPGSPRCSRRLRRANTPARVRLVQGSHIVVRRLYDHDRCYIFQNADNRIVFAIPYEDDFTLIGTTDRDYTGDPARSRRARTRSTISARAASEYFRRPVPRGRRRLDLFGRAPAL